MTAVSASQPAIAQAVSTPFSRRFGLRLPLVHGPMAGGPTTPALVAEVSNDGDYLSLWSGQGAPLARLRAAGLGAAELVDALDAELRATLHRFAADTHHAA